MKTTNLTIRLNDCEKKIIKLKSEALGLTITDYIKYSCILNTKSKKVFFNSIVTEKSKIKYRNDRDV